MPTDNAGQSRRMVSSLLDRRDVSLDPDSDAAVEQHVLRLSSGAIFVGALVWGALYLFNGEPLASLVPFSYSLITGVSYVIAARTGGMGWYRDLQFGLILVLPFLLMTILGGFVEGSAVIIWALLAPVGALLSTKPERALGWFIAYVLLVGVAIVAAQLRTDPSSLPLGVRNALFVANLVTPTGITFLVVREFVAQRDKARSLLRLEQEKSESLLLNVLPEPVAERLKEDASAIAESYDSVSVLFADIVGFTPMSESESADEVVAMLNDVFSHFDRLAEEFGVEKIRTIGDNYMVAAGVPVERPDHAHALADMALAIRDHVAIESDHTLQFRIGINSGPALAGVIGTSRFQYDIWGDTVNTASRMESHGVPGEIQVSAATAALLEDEFELRCRGMIEVKGKDAMETWILERRRHHADTHERPGT